MSEKIIRDPVHDVIAFRLDQPDDALLFALLGTAEMQRLRRIRQLGMASLAYPGADHSRYSHSLGVMQTARRMLDYLARTFPLDPARRLACVCAALIHDIGHGPFSHVFERVTGTHHEKLTHRLLFDPDSEVHNTLTEYDPTLPAQVADTLAPAGAHTFWNDVVSSQLDADRLDYLLRDSLMTGSRYGGHDLQWLINSMTIDPETSRLAVSWKGVSAAEAYLQSRFHMYRNVYFHKTVRAAEGMVKLALQRASRLAVQRRLPRTDPEGAVARALLGQRLTIDQFHDLDDVTLLQSFKRWKHGDDVVLARLCDGLLNRRLYKTLELHDVQTDAEAQIRHARAREAVAEAGGDDGYDLFLDEAADSPYVMRAEESARAGRELLVVEPNGSVVPMESLSPLLQSLGRQYRFFRIYVNERYRDIAAHAIEA